MARPRSAACPPPLQSNGGSSQVMSQRQRSPSLPPHDILLPAGASIAEWWGTSPTLFVLVVRRALSQVDGALSLQAPGWSMSWPQVAIWYAPRESCLYTCHHEHAVPNPPMLTLALPAEACYNVPNCPIARCPNDQSAHFGVLQLGQYGGHKRRA